VPALGVTLLVLALWTIQGIGFVRVVLPDLRASSIVEWIVATWAGALISLVVLLELYYAIPGASIGQLAWPVTLGLAAVSLGLFVRSGWTRPRVDAHGIAVIAIACLGTLAVLRPLLGHPHLGFYFSNNGEFANYAALADVAQFHDSATTVGAFGLHSREAVGSLHAAAIAQLTGYSALWVIQPVAAATAGLAFAVLGLALRHVARAFQARWPIVVALVLIHAWAVLSASTQCFFTLSFVSQYLCVALWFGALAVLLEVPRESEHVRTIVVGTTLGALACVYPEMLLPSAGLLGTLELAIGRSTRTVARLAIAAALAAVLANRLGFELVLGHLGVPAGGWNIYGNTHPVFDFFAAITGFTNPFSGPATPHAAIVGLAAAGFAAALVTAIATARREARDGIRGISNLTWVFAAGVAGIFWVVARHGDGNNYIALKLLLGFGWLAYLGAAAAIARLAAWRPVLGYVVLALVAICAVDLSRGARQFTHQLLQARKTDLYDARDAESLRAALGPTSHPYIASSWFNVHIIGMFAAYDHDLLAVQAPWPTREAQTYIVGSPVLAVAGFDPATDPKLAGIRLERVWRGRHLALLEPR